MKYKSKTLSVINTGTKKAEQNAGNGVVKEVRYTGSGVSSNNTSPGDGFGLKLTDLHKIFLRKDKNDKSNYGYIVKYLSLLVKGGVKSITDIKRSVDNDNETPISDENVTTSLYVKDELDKLDDKYLRKDKDDRSSGYIASDRGFEAGNFVQEATGAACYQDKDGNWHIETDHLRVRKKAVFTEIEVQEVHHVGGQMMLTAANMIVDYVFEMEDRYRCYSLKKDTDGREVENLWQAGDQAYCNTFNLEKQEDGTLGNHYLWRLVVATNLDMADDAETRTFGDVTIQTADYNFVDLSKEVCAVDSDAPKANDEIVQLGYQPSDDSNRQNAILMAGAGSGSPYIYEFTGINSFTLPEPETRIKPGDNFFTGMMRIQGGSTGAANLEDFPEEVFKAVHIGSVNLLLNSGFTGDYKAEELNASYSLNSSSELFSRGMKHWTGGATINNDTASVSGKSAIIGSLSQSVQLMKGEGYVISFKAKGTSVNVMLGGESSEMALSSEYKKYSLKFVSDGIGTFSISGNATICDLQLERGTIATDWHASPYDNDKTLAEFQALKYIQEAIREGDTTILGGLILSSMIQLGNYKNGKMEKVNAGMSGIYNDDNDVAFWGGGTFEQAIATVMKFKENPKYSPTDFEWKELANFVVSHGGDLFLRGYIHALGGFFRGEINAEKGVFKNVTSPNNGFSIDNDGNARFSTGNIGLFDIIGGYLGIPNDGEIDLSQASAMSLLRDSINFNSASRQVLVGAFKSLGKNYSAIITDKEEVIGTSKHGIYFDIQNSNQTNYAFSGNGNGVLNGLVCGTSAEKVVCNSSTVNIIDLTKSNHFIVKTNVADSVIGLPSLSWLLYTLDLSSDDEFAVEIHVANIGGNTLKVYGRNTSVQGMNSDDYPALLSGSEVSSYTAKTYLLTYTDKEYKAILI